MHEHILWLWGRLWQWSPALGLVVRQRPLPLAKSFEAAVDSTTGPALEAGTEQTARESTLGTRLHHQSETK